MDMEKRNATLESLFKQLEEAEKLKAKILEAIEVTKRKGMIGDYRKPSTNKKFYYVDIGVINRGRYKTAPIHYASFPTLFDTELKHKNNNCFSTEECADHAHKTVVNALLTERFRELSIKGFSEDWERFNNGESENGNYYIVRDKDGKYKFMYTNSGSIVGATAFPSEECAKAVCEHLNDFLEDEKAVSENTNTETDSAGTKAA